MNGMLEELVVEVAIEARVELIVRGFPLHVQRECERDTFLDLHEGLGVGGQVDLHDLIAIVADDEVARGVDKGVQVAQVFDVGDVFQAVLVVFLTDVDVAAGFWKQFSDHAPDGQIVEVHLVEPAVLNGVGKGGGLLWSERRSGTGLCLVLWIKDNVMARVSKGVTSEMLSDGLREGLVELVGLPRGGVMLGVGSAVRQRVVLVGFLGVGIGSYL